MRPARSASFAADASTSAAASRPTRATPRASRRRVAAAAVRARAAAASAASASSSSSENNANNADLLLLPPLVAPAELRASLLASEDLWRTTAHARIRGASGDASAPPRFRLTYMPMRNRAEVPRMLLELSETPYEFECVGFEPWTRAMKPRMASEHRVGCFGKLPVLCDLDPAVADARDGSPLRVGQETAITRHLAARLGLDGGDDVRARATIDSLYAFYFSTMRNNGVTHEGEHYAAGALRDAPAGLRDDAKPTTYRAMRRVNDYSVAERSIATLGHFEEILTRSETGWLGGTAAPSYVDVALFVELLELSEPCHAPDWAERFGCVLYKRFSPISRFQHLIAFRFN
jgi:glutathione S-transferase P